MDAPSVEGLRRNHALDEMRECEFALGERQVAGLACIGLVLIAAFVAIAYLVGRATVAHAAPASSPAAQATGTPPAPPVAAPPTAGAPKVECVANVGTDLFADPAAGAMYIQTAAVERGIATIMAEGLRTHGLPALVAPGPNDTVYRVLVGPFPDRAASQSAKESLAQIGLTAFAEFRK
jgi:cell division septation protein DedD